MSGSFEVQASVEIAERMRADRRIEDARGGNRLPWSLDSPCRALWHCRKRSAKSELDRHLRVVAVRGLWPILSISVRQARPLAVTCPSIICGCAVCAGRRLAANKSRHPDNHRSVKADTTTECWVWRFNRPLRCQSAKEVAGGVTHRLLNLSLYTSDSTCDLQ